MKKFLLFFAGAAIIASCNSNEKSSSSDTTKTDTASKKEVNSIDQKPEIKENWKLVTDTDKMTSKERYYASVASTNKLEFDSPYDGGSTASVLLRNQNKVNEVMLEIDKGQFMCNMTDGCEINVRFDDLPAMKFTGSEPSDGSPTILFIKPEKKFIINLKKAKKMIVQAEFYESGLKNMEFNVEGLKWDH